MFRQWNPPMAEHNAQTRNSSQSNAIMWKAVYIRVRQHDAKTNCDVAFVIAIDLVPYHALLPTSLIC